MTMAKSVEQTYLEAALEAALERTGGIVSIETSAVLHGVAAMLALAERRRKPKPAPPEKLKLPFTSTKLFNELHERGIANFETYDKGSFGRLNKALARVSGIEYEDLNKLLDFIEGVIVPFLRSKGTELTWDLCVRRTPTWIEKARARNNGKPEQNGGAKWV